MKTPIWKSETIHKDDDFTYVLSFEEEFIDPHYHFTVECKWEEEQYSNIKNFYWFCSKITAYKGKIECGSAYLGGNCYKDKKDVMGAGLDTMLGGYAPQMIEEAREEALDNLEIK